MDRKCCGKPEWLLSRVAKWQHVGGGVDSSGNEIEKPIELVQAEFIEALCMHYHVLPSQILQEDMTLLRMRELLSIDSEKGKK